MIDVAVKNCCTGKCCESFYFGKENAAHVQEQPEEVWDGPFIADMLVPLDDEMRARYDWSKHDPDDYFTCRHWDRETRLCTVYDQRPTMCRQFPYGKECPGCDFNEGIPGGEWAERGLLPMYTVESDEADAA